MRIMDSFIFLHMPKTGGSFIASALDELAKKTGNPITKIDKGRWQLDAEDALSKHHFLSRIPAPVLQQKPALICVRNPLSHYVSHYRFQWWVGHENSVFMDEKIRQHYPNYPQLTFHEYLEAVTSMEFSPKADAPQMVQAGVGMLTRQLLHYCFQKPLEVLPKIDVIGAQALRFLMYPKLRIIHAENMNKQLAEFLMKQGFKPNDVAFIRAKKKVVPASVGAKIQGNLSESNYRWQDYYTPEMVARVLQKERLFFKLFPEYKPGLVQRMDIHWRGGKRANQRYQPD